MKKRLQEFLELFDGFPVVEIFKFAIGMSLIVGGLGWMIFSIHATIHFVRKYW